MDGMTDSMDLSLSKLLRYSKGQGNLVRCSHLGSQRVGYNLVIEQQIKMFKKPKEL